MSYTPQEWVNNSPSTPLSATRLLYIENGIKVAADVADDAKLLAQSANSLANTKQNSLGIGSSIAGTPSSKNVLGGDGQWRRPTRRIEVWWVVNQWVWPDGTVDNDPSIARTYESQHDASATVPTSYSDFDRWNKKQT